MRVTLDEPWLLAHLPGPHEVLSWAIVGGGRVVAHTVAWLQVTNADLPEDVDPVALLEARLAGAGLSGAVGLLTAAGVARYTEAEARSGDVVARALVTVGLRNALRAGDPVTPAQVGTINLLVSVNVPLSEAALVEALAVAVEGRALAVLEAGTLSKQSGLPASGTGTDCVVIAAPRGGQALAYAGKHTDVGASVGRAALEATRAGALQWFSRQAAKQKGMNV